MAEGWHRVEVELVEKNSHGPQIFLPCAGQFFDTVGANGNGVGS